MQFRAELIQFDTGRMLTSHASKAKSPRRSCSVISDDGIAQVSAR